MPLQSIFATYEISLASSAGVYVMPLDTFQTLQMTRTVNAVGSLTITLPYTDRLWNAARKDAIVDVWRSGTRGGLKRVMGGLWFVVGRQQALTADGKRTITLVCADQLDLVRRFVVLFDTSVTGIGDPSFSGTAEAVIKQLITANLLSTAGSTPARPVFGNLGAYITVEASAGRGYSPSAIAASWQNVLAVCTQVARASTQYGSYLAFDMEPQSVNPPTFIFRCYTNQRGVDRSPSGLVPLVMSDASGAFGAATYAEDFSTSASYVLCGGQTSGGTTSTGSAVDTTLDSVGPFAHTESYVSQQMASDTDTLNTQASDGLRVDRPAVGFSNLTIVQSPAMQLGVDFDFGDRITAKLGNQATTCRLEVLTLSYSAAANEGQPVETLTGTLRSEYSP